MGFDNQKDSYRSLRSMSDSKSPSRISHTPDEKAVDTLSKSQSFDIGEPKEQICEYLL